MKSQVAYPIRVHFEKQKLIPTNDRPILKRHSKTVRFSMVQ